ncbi:YbjQ family protein [uncultured Dysosmobacter sp.]|uniref:YbjQ family protein n=1 Tax=uncultured Dysosmobacter sp. TaxID=2591384 RepID=UPI0026723236|nr:heavy metal-binding domain-containing protein [uncultured Dysosmobacter sp.]
MKIKEITEKYGIDFHDFEMFATRHPETVKVGLLSYYVDDANVPQAVEQFKAEMERRAAIEKEKPYIAEREEQSKKEQEREEQERAQALASILITSGFNFDGYKIVKYSGYISGDDATQIPRSGIFGGNNGKNLTDALVKIRIQAIKELKEAAYDLGCNAVIGVDFDYITLEPETATLSGGTLYEPYIICVTANGNAVIIEKD